MQPVFPGMNPYLEAPELWVEVHSWLIIQLARSLNPILKPKYRAAVEQRTYSDTLLIGIPDISVYQATGTLPKTSIEPELQEPGLQAESRTGTLKQPMKQPMRVTLPLPQEVRETYLEIRLVATGEVVTVLEVLSPKNKRLGEGRNKYITKRNKVLDSRSHLIEIDLLRSGLPQEILEISPSDYRILVSRASDRPAADLYAFNLREPIPAFPLPLQPEDPAPIIDLDRLLNQIYDEALLELSIDYSQPPVPPVTTADWQWMQSLLS